MIMQKIKSMLPHIEIEILGQKFRVRKKYAKKFNESISSLLVLLKLKSFIFITTPDIRKTFNEVEDRLKYGFGADIRFIDNSEEKTINTQHSLFGSKYAFQIHINLDKEFKFVDFNFDMHHSFEKSDKSFKNKFINAVSKDTDDYEKRVREIMCGKYKTSSTKEAIEFVDILKKII